MPVVIGAASLNRCGKAFEAKLLQARGGDAEALEAAAHVVAVDQLLAGQLLRGADVSAMMTELKTPR